tara:strand:- start:2308 stop:2532 length:225 start_codon:yes stop_codon:yes gene_type:complete
MKTLFKARDLIIEVDISKDIDLIKLNMLLFNWDAHFDLEMWNGGSIEIDEDFSSITISGDNGLVTFEPIEVLKF